jgi:hypothetical protein
MSPGEQAELATLLSQIQLPHQWSSLLRQRFADSIELAREAEGIALENVADNLFEFDVVLPESVRVRLSEFCTRYGVAPDRVRLLDLPRIGNESF